MSVKYKLLTQNAIVLISTILIPVCAGFGYFYFLNLFNKVPDVNGFIETDIVVIKNESIIYQSNNFSNFEIKEMIMNLDMHNNTYVYDKTKYKISLESFETSSNDKYDIIKLTPALDTNNYYLPLFVFVTFVFLLTFIIGSIIMQKRNNDIIINPIKSLKTNRQY